MANPASITDGIRLFLDDLDQYPLPDHDEQVELAKRVAAGDDEARRQMIAANLRLVVHWARRYQDRGVDFGDLVQEGTFGLMRAVDKFDWQRGFRFSTYATWWIRQALQRAVQQHGEHHPGPHGGGRAGPARRAHHVGAGRRAAARPHPRRSSRGQWRRQQGPPRRCRARPGWWPASTSPPAATAARRSAISSAATTAGSKRTSNGDWCSTGVRDAVDRLDELERDVVTIRYGLDGGTPASLQATASRLGIGVRRARQAESRALEQLATIADVEAAHQAA